MKLKLVLLAAMAGLALTAAMPEDNDDGSIDTLDTDGGLFEFDDGDDDVPSGVLEARSNTIFTGLPVPIYDPAREAKHKHGHKHKPHHEKHSHKKHKHGHKKHHGKKKHHGHGKKKHHHHKKPKKHHDNRCNSANPPDSCGKPVPILPKMNLP